MRKIPTLILALIVLAGNAVAAPVFAVPTNQISVSATVLEQLSLVRSDSEILVETNSKTGFYCFIDNSVFSASKKAAFTVKNNSSIVIVARF